MKGRPANYFWFINGAALTLAVILFLDVFGVLPSISQKGVSPYGLLYADKEASFRGYTLLNPLRGPSVYLLDWNGKAVRTWTVPGLPTYEEIRKDPTLIFSGVLQAKLLSNGHLLLGYGEKDVAVKKIDSGSMSRLVEFDKEGKIIWEYRNEEMHNDFERLPARPAGGPAQAGLPDDRTAIIVWEEVPSALAKRVRGGIPKSDGNRPMVSDAIVEIDRDGNEVWRWSLKENLNPELPENYLDSLSVRSVWTHLDSLEYLERNPITGKPAYLISINKLDTIALVERDTGRIIWRWGSGVLAGQHSAVLTKDDQVLTFDNGVRRAHSRWSHGLVPGISALPYSRMIKVDVQEKRISFQFAPGELEQGRAIFYTPLNGNVQELPNGNILVSAGVTGRVFEIEPKTKKVVWDYVSPFGFAISGWPSAIQNSVYSAFRYPKEYVQ